MRLPAALILCFAACASAFSDGNTDAQKIMRSAVELRALSAKTRADAAEQCENICRLDAAAKARAAALDAETASLEKRLAEFSDANAEISAAIKNDVENLEKLSAFLDKFYSSARAELPDLREFAEFAPDALAGKTAPEKLRFVLRFLDALEAFDSSARFSGGRVQTGLFVRGAGEVSDGVARIKVEGVK